MPHVPRRSVLWPVTIVSAVIVASVLATGVTVGELLRFVAYEAAYVLVPGVIALAILVPRRRPRRLERLFLGFAIGITIELAAFTLTAALHKRDGLPLYPLPFYVLALVLLATGRWRLPRLRETRASASTGWPAAVVAVAVVVCLVTGFFLSNPLPRSADNVAYDQDLVYHLALSAEAKNRWPMRDPNISFESLHYHTFANRDMAAVSRVTGISLDVVLFRLMPIALLIAMGVGLASLTLMLGGSAGSASLAVALGLVAGELDVDTKLPLPFLSGSLLSHLQSPSFFFGAVFFLAALYVLIELLGVARPARPRLFTLEWWGAMAVLAIILGGASGAKANVLPVLIAGLGLFVVAQAVWNRRLDGAVVLPLALLLLAFLVGYVLLYRGGQGHGFDVLPVHFGRAVWPHATWLGGTAVEGVALLPAVAPLVGVIGLIVARRFRLRAPETLSICMLLVALGAFLLLSQPGGAEIYFLLYGTLAAVPLSALGVAAMWRRLPSPAWPRLTVLLVAGGLVMLVAAVIAAAILGSLSPPTPKANLIVAGALVLVAVATAWVLASIGLQGGRRASFVLGLAMPLILVIAFLDYPLDTGSRLASRWSRGEPAWQQSVPGKESGITRGLSDGLEWLRGHTQRSAVVAVNNFDINPGFPRYFYYAAFGERTTFIGGWAYSERAAPVLKGKPLPPDLVSRAQTSLGASLGDPAALQALASAGVNYLLVDKLNAQYGDAAKVGALIKPVFENNAVAIYPLTGL